MALNGKSNLLLTDLGDFQSLSITDGDIPIFDAVLGLWTNSSNSANNNVSPSTTFGGPMATTAAQTLSVSLVNGIANLSIPAFSATANGTTTSLITSATAIPAQFRPLVTFVQALPVNDGGTQSAGLISINTAGIISVALGQSLTASQAWASSGAIGITNAVNLAYSVVL